MIGSVRRATYGLCLTAAIAVVAPAAAFGQSASDVWDPVAGTLPASRGGAPADVQPDNYRAFTLDQSALGDKLDNAPAVGLRARALAKNAITLSLPAPGGGFQRFEVQESPIMEPELAARHPEIKTYSGRGVDDPTATIRADNSPAGFHASVRSPHGSWYIDPYYHLDDSVYVSYYTKDVPPDEAGTFVERDGDAEAVAADAAALDVPTGPDVSLRTYRLALVTDPSYSNFFGGPANVTAAKVTLINRVDQIYEDETAIRLVLIADTEKTNLNTAADATGANGPCGAAPCFTAATLASCGSGQGLGRNRILLGRLVGASNYDIGHLGLGVNGGGVANLGVVGGNAKAQGCTGLPTPVGDFYAVDYVAHEMGHQFAGNHTFNGTQLNCSGGNRNAAASVEPGSGTSVMAYAGICLTDDLQAHSDPYFSERSQQEISTYTSSNQAAINENQEVALRHFGGGNEVQVATFGPGFAPTSTIQPATVAIGGVPNATQLGGAQEIGNTVTISTGAAGATHTLQPGDEVTISGVANAGYNGTFTVTSVPGTRAFTYTNPVSGLPVSGGGTITLSKPGLTELGNTVTVNT